MAEKILVKLKELKGGSPRLIVNTHFHYDHTGGNEVFGSTAAIIAATEVRERLMSEQILWHKKHEPVPTKALPILTFDHSLTLHMNDDDIEVLHLPHGHTDGDKSALEKYYRMIVASITTFRNGIQKGQTLEQIQKAGLDREWVPFRHAIALRDMHEI